MVSSAFTSVTPVISAWSAVSCYGIGRSAYELATLAGRAPEAVQPTPYSPRPADVAYPVPDFDPRVVLGRKGTRTMDRVSGFAVTVTRELLKDLTDEDDRDRTAVVLGTTGSPQAMRDFTRSSLLAARPFHVNPAVIPSGVPNCAAGLVAIWHGLTGPNATVNTGRVATWSALSYARRLLAAGRADRVIVGAVEEYSPTRAWLNLRHEQPDDAAVGIGEGGVAFLLEPVSNPVGAREPLLDVLHVAHGVFTVPENVEAAVSGCVGEALDRTGLRATDIGVALSSACPGEPGRRERDALNALFPRSVLDVVAPARNGDTGAATAAFQLATVLATPVRGPSTPSPVVITTVDPGGGVACAIVGTRAEP